MDLFKDKKYEGFDELTQLIEPFIFPVNDFISLLPTEVTLSLKDVIAMRGRPVNDSGYTNPLDAIMYYARKERMITAEPDYEVRSLISGRFYKFEIADGTQVDLTNNTMTGEIKVVRKRGLFDDNEIMALMLDKVNDRLSNNIGKASEVPAARFHELAESFGFLEEMKKRTTFKERKAFLRTQIVDAIKSNEIRIRDYSLAMRFADWVHAFLADGNLAALKNIAMLKIVSHEGKAIYSINEEKI